MFNFKLRRLITLSIAILIVAVSFFPSISSSSVNKTSTIDMKFDIKVKLLMRFLRLPSLIICIIKNNNIAFMKPYGFTDFYLRKKASNDNIYLVGSISKSVTATALMQLYEKGLFDLDEDVSNHLPFNLKNPKYPEINITFRMLLSHQTSLNDFGLRLRSVPHILISSRRSNSFYPLIKEMLVPGERCYSRRYWLNRPPGQVTLYSELDIIIAGYLVERLSGQSLEDYCQDNIFKPLDMTSTSFYPDKLNKKKLAKPYACIGRRFIPFPKYDFCFLDPPGGLWTRAKDLAHFFMAHMNGGLYKGIRILEEDTVNQMHKVQYQNFTDKLFSLFFRGRVKVQYGLGWEFVDFLGINLEGHSGGSPGYNCHMYIMDYKENERVGAILLSNGPFFSPAIFSYRYTIFGYKRLIESIIQKIDEM